MTVQTYKYVKTEADANGVYDLGSIVQLDDAGAVAINLLAAGAIVMITRPIDGSTMPAPTDPAPVS
jgi:hypothetical protein